MISQRYKRAIGTFPNRQQAEAALHDLRNSAFSMNGVFILAKDTGAGLGAAAGGIVGALTGLGIPEEEARADSEQVSRGEYLVILDGTEAEMNRAAALLMTQGIREWRVHDIFDMPTTPRTITTTSDVEVVNRQKGM
jgi:hydrogenase maturation factor